MVKKNIFRYAIASILLLAVMLVCTPASSTVECSASALIAAINNANINPAPSTLELDPGCIYLLTAVDNTATVYGDNGLPQIITPITINGNNATIIRASEAPNFRFFYIMEPGSLTINDLTLENGFADGTLPGGGGSVFPGSGGAIYNSGTYLEVNSSTLQNNRSTANAGAVFAVGGNTNTYINGSIIHNNTSHNGGGIYIYHFGLLSVDTSEITNNRDGGISLQDGAELIIKDSLIAFNHTDAHGGGIFKNGGAARSPTTISGTIFNENTADRSGGAVFILRTPLKISDSQFSNNQADEYGGGLGYQNNSTESVHISNTTFDGNSAKWDGGAIHFSGKLMTIDDSTIHNNHAENGAGIHNGPADDPSYIIRPHTTLIMTNSTLKENMAVQNGGGVFNESVMTCGDCHLVGNESLAGGGIYNNGFMTVEGSNFSGNQASTLGGGVHNNMEITVKDSTFEGNLALADGGGLNSYGMAFITGSTFSGNTGFRGGGMASVGGNAQLINNTFSANTATDSGGGIFNMEPFIGHATRMGGFQASHITVAYNSAPAGGGIATSGGGVRIKNSIVALNPSGSDCYTTPVEFTSLGDNLDSDATCSGFNLKDDPLLDPLASNGGPTFTHALIIGSPAMDAALDCTTVGVAPVSIDQRGEPRPGGLFCDLGAYEDEKGAPLPPPAYIIFKRTLDCRLEPSSSSMAITSFRSDDRVEVVGRNINLTWFQVAPPELEDPCWVWVGGVEFFGDLESVEIIHPKIPVEDEEKLPDDCQPPPGGCPSTRVPQCWDATQCICGPCR